MKTTLRSFGPGLAALALLVTAPAAHAAEAPVYEMRTYYAVSNKLDALHARFRDHTVKLFEKHGMKNIGYWVPVDNPERKLIYILEHAGVEAKDRSWKAFLADPEWQAARKASEVDGGLVAKMECVFLQATDFSPVPKPAASDPPRTFELRTYTSSPGNLSRLLARFRDFTMKLFEKHGITNIAYWTPAPGDPRAGNTLIYLLAHKNPQAAAASFAAFRADPDWIKAKADTEQAAGGSLTVTNGVQSVLLQPTDYSPMK